MPDHESALKIYFSLAIISHEKSQTDFRDRFLLLAGGEALQAGWLPIAEAIYTHLCAAQPHQQLANYDSFANAMRTEDFQFLWRQTQRRYTVEHAEQLLAEATAPTIPSDSEDFENWTRRQLASFTLTTP